MFERGDFSFDLTQFYVSDRPARFVKEINDSPRRAAEQDDEKAERADEFGDGNGHAAQIAQEHLQNLFAQTDSCETDWQSS